jgi:CRP-like cAMP-binding protein
MAIERLMKQTFFDFLRPEQVNRLSEAAEVVRFMAGDLVYSQGAEACHCYVVLKGRVALRLRGERGVSVLIEELSDGDMFGGCLSPGLGNYVLTSQCVADSELLMLTVSVLRKIMEEDPRIGYAMQARVSEIYFNRYVETMKKLQSIVMNIPVETS